MNHFDYIPSVTDADKRGAERVLTCVKENLGAVPTEEGAIRDVLNSDELSESVAYYIAETRAASDVERVGDAIIRWVVTITVTLCCSAFLAAYAAQYLLGK